MRYEELYDPYIKLGLENMKSLLAKLRDSNNIILVITRKVHMAVLIHMDMHLPITDT